jgi:hypothetical protein
LHAVRSATTDVGIIPVGRYLDRSIVLGDRLIELTLRLKGSASYIRSAFVCGGASQPRKERNYFLFSENYERKNTVRATPDNPNMIVSPK